MTISKGTKIETKTASIVESVPVRFAQTIPGFHVPGAKHRSTESCYSLSRGHVRGVRARTSLHFTYT